MAKAKETKKDGLSSNERREFLKRAGRTGIVGYIATTALGSAIGGGLGFGAGKGYKVGRDTYTKLDELEEQGKKMYHDGKNSVRDFRDDTYDVGDKALHETGNRLKWLRNKAVDRYRSVIGEKPLERDAPGEFIPRVREKRLIYEESKPKPPTSAESKTILGRTRRAFLGLANRHPVKTGTIGGTTIIGGLTAAIGKSGYTAKRDAASLYGTVIDQDAKLESQSERISALEEKLGDSHGDERAESQLHIFVAILGVLTIATTALIWLKGSPNPLLVKILGTLLSLVIIYSAFFSHKRVRNKIQKS
ncbi:MAG: hypothetical protein IH845_02575 [Nanoarchaeota archaeon]|nr:hypothetical protein [Nanoarchaeota archaeon]